LWAASVLAAHTSIESHDLVDQVEALGTVGGANLTMIDCHYGHLARDGRDHAINLLDAYSSLGEDGVHQVDVAWTLQRHAVATSANERRL
jgi:hypothetical protein